MEILTNGISPKDPRMDSLTQSANSILGLSSFDTQNVLSKSALYDYYMRKTDDKIENANALLRIGRDTVFLGTYKFSNVQYIGNICKTKWLTILLDMLSFLLGNFHTTYRLIL